MLIRWDTIFIMVCSAFTGMMCALAFVIAFTRRVVHIVDNATVAVAAGREIQFIPQANIS